MPLEDLESLGYLVTRSPEGMQPVIASVYGYGQQWGTTPGIENEDKIVAEARNHKKLYDKLEQAQQYFSDAYTNWPTMSNAQKDIAMRNAMRQLANLTRHVRNDLTSEGV